MIESTERTPNASSRRRSVDSIVQRPARAGSDLRRAASGQRDAVRRCIQRLGPWIAGLVRARYGEKPELVAEIFEQLWRSAPEHDPDVESELVFAARVARRTMGAQEGRTPVAETRATPCDGAPAAVLSESNGCGETARLAPFVASLRPDQMQLLRTALTAGSGRPIGGEDTAERGPQRSALHELMLGARRALETGRPVGAAR